MPKAHTTDLACSTLDASRHAVLGLRIAYKKPRRSDVEVWGSSPPSRRPDPTVLGAIEQFLVQAYRIRLPSRIVAIHSHFDPRIYARRAVASQPRRHQSFSHLITIVCMLVRSYALTNLSVVTGSYPLNICRVSGTLFHTHTHRDHHFNLQSCCASSSLYSCCSATSWVLPRASISLGKSCSPMPYHASVDHSRAPGSTNAELLWPANDRGIHLIRFCITDQKAKTN
jgi:hypothetical protein